MNDRQCVFRWFSWLCLMSALTLMSLMLAAAAGAAEYIVRGSSDKLEATLSRAAPGDTVVVEPGIYSVHLVLDRPVKLQGRPGAVLDGAGSGDVIRVRAPDVTVRGLRIQRSGTSLNEMNAGIFVERPAARVVIEDNELERNGFGIWLDGCHEPQVLGNRIHGEPALRSQDRGNGVHLYNVQGALVAGNEIWEARDGIYIDTSTDSTLSDNYIHDLRFGIHYMYSHDNRVTGNHTSNTRTGYALMQSKKLMVTENRSVNDINYGILMNFITYSYIENNVVLSVARGKGFVSGGAPVKGAEGKGIFIYNSLYNTIRGNHFSDNDIGIHLTAGSEDNRIHGNGFVGNRTQVKYVATREQEWSLDGHGNYWSDYLGWDLNGDGIGDRFYEPNDAVDKLLWKYPLARMLMNSPAVQTLRWVQEQFPVLQSPGIRDSFPVMTPLGPRKG
jgi:nitrous oxidase accessory protein